MRSMMTIDSAAIRLTDTILGQDEPDLEQALRAIAVNIGVLHIAYVPLCSQKSEDANLLSAICTYPVEWQARYFKKQYWPPFVAKIPMVLWVKALHIIAVI